MTNTNTPCRHPFWYGKVTSESTGEGALLGRDTHYRDVGLVNWTRARMHCRDCGADLGERQFKGDDFDTGRNRE